MSDTRISVAVETLERHIRDGYLEHLACLRKYTKQKDSVTEDRLPQFKQSILQAHLNAVTAKERAQDQLSRIHVMVARVKPDNMDEYSACRDAEHEANMNIARFTTVVIDLERLYTRL